MPPAQPATPPQPEPTRTGGGPEPVAARVAQVGEQRSRPRGPAGSSFVPGLVHELHNFSFGISGSLDAMQVRFGGLAELAPYQAVLRTSLERLNAFLEELREYGDPGPPAWAGTDPERLLRAAIGPHLDPIRAAGAELRLELDPGLPPIRADAQGLERVFSRLVGLACTGLGPGDRVTLHLAAGPGGVLLGHLDNPRLALPGVDLERLFEPFYYRAAGFGRLALPVARRVLERYGGTLSAAPGPGGGVRLAFSLPVAPVS